jgi:two-component system chemotaxis response regulator CheB
MQDDLQIRNPPPGRRCGSVNTTPMFQVVVIAASAGGLPALRRVLTLLPASFPVPLAIVQHVAPTLHSSVAHVIGRRAALVVKEAVAGEPMFRGVAYVAPPGRHLLIGGGLSVKISDSDPVRFVRPAADVLFTSAARICHDGVIAVVLTGSGSDGTAGAKAIKMAGGTVIAQDEATSLFFGMPRSAIQAEAVDFVVPLDAIAGRLLELTRILS